MLELSDIFLGFLDGIGWMIPFLVLQKKQRNRFLTVIALFVYSILNVLVSTYGLINEYTREALLGILSYLLVVFVFKKSTIFDCIILIVSLLITNLIASTIVAIGSRFLTIIYSVPFVLAVLHHCVMFISLYFFGKYMREFKEEFTDQFSKQFLLTLLPITLFFGVGFQILFEVDSEYRIIFSLLTDGFILIYFYLIRKLFFINNQYQRQKLLLELEKKVNERQLVTQDERKLSVIRHDLLNILIPLKSYVQNNELEKANHYLNQYVNEIEKTKIVNYTCSPEVNELLQMKITGHPEILFCVNGTIRDFGTIDTVDICILLGNLLDNAVEEISNHNQTKKEIHIELQEKQSFVKFLIRNSLSEMKDYTTHKDEESLHGLGLFSVKSITEKYHGTFDINQDDEFVVRVLLLK